MPYEVPFFQDPDESLCAPPRTEEVACVVDGDTFDLSSCGDAGERVRLLGVDTPEVYIDDPNADCKEGQYDEEADACCYGPEASSWMKTLLSGTAIVDLEFDATCQDDYGRTLAYAWLRTEDVSGGDDTASEDYDGDRMFLNAELITRGYARVYTGDTSIRYYQEFVNLQTEAVQDEAGLWGACE